MRLSPLPCQFLAVSFTLSLLSSLAWGQAPTHPAAVEASTQPPTVVAKLVIEPRFEHLQLEDSGAVIDEVRLGGQTQSITVQPKGGMPAYQIDPVGGERSWKVLGF